MLGERLAQDIHNRIVFQALERRHFGAVDRGREGDAGPRGRSVDQHGARAANAVLAADMRRRQVLVLAQEVDET